MLDMYKSNPVATERPDHIIFDGHKVKTAQWIDVPEHFVIKLGFLSEPDSDQGADISIKEGYLLLPNGSQVKTLRTWNDPQFEKFVEYKGYSKAKKLLVYNVYKEIRNNRAFEEKWTNNAGMIVEQEDNGVYICKCSSSSFNPPNFESIIFQVAIHEVKS